MSSTRCGISAKQLEREIGCNYKTALRMLRKIRTDLMAQDDAPLGGEGVEVEADEMFHGGRIRESERRKRIAQGIPARGPATKPRPVVFGAVERGGRIRASVVGNSRNAQTVRDTLCEFVLPKTMLFTDDWSGYDPLAKTGRYTHRRIRHSERIYVSGSVHTQSIEGFFGLFKTGVRGTHHAISKRWLHSYLNEWVWRYNHRDDDRAQYRTLLLNAASQT
jgi:transposase-like protein